MKGSLLSRNIGLLVGVVLAGQLLAGLLVVALVVRPQTVRVADISARMLNAVSIAMEGRDHAEQARIAARIDAQGGIRLRPAGDPPGAEGRVFPGFLERMFMRALAERLAGQEELAWRTDRSGRLWIELRLGGTPWWVSITPPRLAAPMASLVLASLVAFVVAAAGGLVLQRRLDRPLRQLAQGVAAFRPGSALPAVAVEGPREIAAVAQAFNDMSARIAAHEEERTLMLAGVSHDLRTPLARLRLAVEMMRDDDRELRESAGRQVEQIDHMLGQFLDFARAGSGEPRRTVALAQLLEAAVEDAGMDCVGMDVPAGLEAGVRPMAIRRAVKNLLENADAHGAPPVAIRARRESGGGIAIEVTDGGAGFDPAMADHLLKPFARANAARGGKGTGLGLAIAQRQVADEGGTLRFERTAEGFRATILLPAAE